MNKTVLTISIILLFLIGCVPVQPAPTYEQQKGVQGIVVGDTYSYESKETETNQKRLIDATPVPKLQTSLERENIAKRLTLLNDRDKLFYVYLIDHGTIVGYFVAQGKVSSVSSYLTSSEQIIPSKECLATAYSSESRTNCYHAIEAPDQDGSYGTNGDGIFFFTAEGAYVEWRGAYLVSDFPMKINQPTQLVRVQNVPIQ